MKPGKYFLLRFILLFLVIFIFCVNDSNGQSVDSVFTTLRSQQPDSARARQLSKLFYRFVVTGKVSELLQLSDSVIALSAEGNLKYCLATGYSTKGKALNEKGNYEKAKENLKISLKIYEELKDKKGIGDLYNTIGRICVDQGKNEEAFNYYYSSIKILTEVNDRAGISTAYNNIGSLYVTQGNKPEAIKNYNKSLELREEIKDRQGMSSSLNNLGNVYFAYKDYAKALEYYQRSLLINKEFGRKRWMSNNYLGIGSVYEQMKDYNKAMENYRIAMDIKREIGDQNGIAACYISFGDVSAARKEFGKAKAYLDSSLTISKEIGNNGMIKDTYRSLAKLSYSSGDFKNAYDYYEQFTKAKDSVINEQNLKAVAKLQSQFDLERKDNEIKLLNKENEVQAERSMAESRRQRIVIWSVVGILLVVGIFSLLIYNRWKISQKQKLIIEEQQNNILDSIRYAKKIQKTVMPGEQEVKSILPFDSFIFFQPKAIVSGDFYWVSSVNVKGADKYIVAVGDCTGHGVPGAFLTMMGSTLIKEAIGRNMIQPAEILGHIHREVVSTLSRAKEMDAAGDGMDIAICVIDPAQGTLTYAGAMLSVYLVRSGNKKAEVLKSDSISIGVMLKNGQELIFNQQTVPIEKNSCLYLFSDGFSDQYSKQSNARFGTKRFRELCERNAEFPMNIQKENFAKVLLDWQGTGTQLDDILVMGIRV